MGINKRAAMREELMRRRIGSVERIIVQWKTNDGDLLVNFLNVRSKLPITHQRVWHDKATLLAMIERSVTPPVPHGPKGIMLRRNLESGRGEIEIEISGEQFATLCASPRRGDRATASDTSEQR